MIHIARAAATAVICGTIAVAGTGIASAEPVTQTPVIHPAASPVEDQAAIAYFSTVLGAASAGGGMAGTIGGAVVGCGAGAALGLPLAIVPGAIGGCLAGAAIGAPIGTVVGTVIVGGPALAIAGADLVGTLSAAPGTTRFAPQGGAR